MNKSITYYNQLSLFAILIFLVLVFLQIVWVVKAVKFQEKEIIHKLKEVVADVAMEINGIDHSAFHGELENMLLIPTEVMTKKVNDYLQSKDILNKTYFAIFQESSNGIFRTNGNEFRKQFFESNVRACMSCIVSFSTISEEGNDKLDKAKMFEDKEYMDSIYVHSTFQYYSPVKNVDDLNDLEKDTIWFSLYQPNTLSIAIKSLVYLFAINIILLLLLLALFYNLFKSLSQHKQLTKVKDDFFNNMSHEFKTPLSSIRLASKVLQQNVDSEKREIYHKLIEKESKTLEYQIDKLLELSLLDNNEIPLEKEPLIFCSVLKEIPIKLKPMLDEKSGQLTIDCQLGNICIQGDCYHLLNSLCNLVENSLKYSPASVKIDIRAFENANKVQIIVKDNGPGIKKEHHANIFSRFYRAQHDNEYKGQGFGIGLSYVKSIIEAHQGTIVLNAENKEGTEFIIQLPKIKA